MNGGVMPRGPRGEKRPADVIGNTVKVMRIATGEETAELPDSAKAAAIPAGTKFTLKAHAAEGSPTYPQFLLSAAPEPEAVNLPTGISVEVYRSPSPIPGLIRETSLLSLAKVPVPPESPCDALHQRSGAALHYILSGVGAEFTEGRATAKGPGSVSYEPIGTRPRRCCPRPRPQPCCSGRCSPLVRSRCAKSTDGRPPPTSSLTSRLTSLPDPVSSANRRTRNQIPTQTATAPAIPYAYPLARSIRVKASVSRMTAIRVNRIGSRPL
jgi:hypothetical protein